ncbi:RNA-guided pseudouridylation complex pseudouridine synthase subunit Cbf5, partial [Candidatus Woesearchaeota archaeon]|nr:RNA-guided pseudouridylation complex pseudouridine synthase subunit Cbf5 [Candidatus Woesearchaeota archaeon]
MGQLPFERIPRGKLVRQEATTSQKYGCAPGKRSMQALLHYGVINLDKPAGPSSHQVSSYVKKILRIKKAGHSG